MCCTVSWIAYCGVSQNILDARKLLLGHHCGHLLFEIFFAVNNDGKFLQVQNKFTKKYPASCSIIALRTYSKRLRFGQEALFLSVKTSGSDRLWDTRWCNKHRYLLANVIVLIIFYYNSGL